MTLTNQELLAEAVRTIPAWQRFLVEKRNEQVALLAKMRADDILPVGEGAQTSVAPSTDSDESLAWLRGEASPPSTKSTATPSPLATLETGAPAPAPTLSERFMGRGGRADRSPTASHESGQPAVSGKGEARALAAPLPSATASEFQAALSEVGTHDLPFAVQEALRIGDEEQMARAFVTARREGELPDRLADAVDGMSEVDHHFAAADLDEFGF